MEARRATDDPGRADTAGAGEAWVPLGRGAHGVVELDPTSRIVRKRIHRSHALAGAYATREYTYLHRLHAALVDLPYLSCPRPIRVDERAATIDMTFCDGTTLDHLLRDGDDDFDEHIDHIAEQAALAVERSVAALGEPLFSLSTANMLYQPATRVLHLIDFSSPRAFPGLDLERRSWEVSLGCCIARSLYQTSGPRSLWRRRYRHRHDRLTRALLRCAATRRRLDRQVLREVVVRASPMYARGARAGRSLHAMAVHWLWYETVGRSAFALRSSSLLSPSEGAPWSRPAIS